MSSRPPAVRIAIYGHDPKRANERHGCGLWAAGIAACLTAAEAEPVPLGDLADRPWDEVLEGLQGVVLTGHDQGRCQAAEASSCASGATTTSSPCWASTTG